MDLTTVLGIGGAVAMVVIAVATGQVTKVFLNFHGVFLVGGGTFVSLLLNTPREYFWQAVKSVGLMVVPPRGIDRKEALPVLLNASREVHSRGIVALRSVDPTVAGGFLGRAAQLASEFNDPEYVRTVLENEINQDFDYKNEIINVYRTMGVVAPMFGLIGTLIGIVDVLRHISNPEEVAPAMAVAVTTAFYGILLANLVAVPIAGKLRIRHWEEYVVKTMVLESVIQMLEGTVPAILERRLRAFTMSQP